MKILNYVPQMNKVKFSLQATLSLLTSIRQSCTHSTSAKQVKTYETPPHAWLDISNRRS
jgi:hypothetical protein